MSKGIDIPIDDLVELFEAKLWTGNNCDFHGRIFRNESTNEISNDIIPEYFSDGEYKEILLDDTFDAICFFDVLPESEIIGTGQADTRICFAVNLDKLYPSVGTRATEYAHEDVFKLVHISQGFVEGTGRLIRGLPSFSDYSTVKANDDLHPWYLFRFDVRFEYEFINC